MPPQKAEKDSGYLSTIKTKRLVFPGAGETPPIIPKLLRKS